jgi:hypothetical protein
VPSPQAAHGVRRAIGTAHDRDDLGAVASSVSDSAVFAPLLAEVPGARGAEGPRTISPIDGAACSRVSA